jgi:NAD-dependent SIR2 family protein deacetylase
VSRNYQGQNTSGPYFSFVRLITIVPALCGSWGAGCGQLMSRRAAKRAAAAAARVEPCPICGASLQSLDEDGRQRHVNRCLEKRPAGGANSAAADAGSAAEAPAAGGRKKRKGPVPPQPSAQGGAAAAAATAAGGQDGPENNVAGYAARLRQDVDYGVCGLKETRESAQAVRRKVARLATLLRQHKGRVWCCTGAGISTSAGLPDFRGPHGIWTKQQQESGKLKSPAGGGRAAPRLASSFGAVKPSFTHHALTALVKAGYINHIATQNVDGLHRRADAPLEKLSELHGNVCLEVCTECKAEFHRADDVGGVGLQPTGRVCDACGGALRDHVLDWDDALPKEHVRRTERRARKATMSIALGTSLRIKPVGDMPVRASCWSCCCCCCCCC